MGASSTAAPKSAWRNTPFLICTDATRALTRALLTYPHLLLPLLAALGLTPDKTGLAAVASNVPAGGGAARGGRAGAAARAGERGTLHLDVPTGWTVSPASRPFALKQAGEKARLAFTLTAPAQMATGTVQARLRDEADNVAGIEESFVKVARGSPNQASTLVCF